MREHSGLPCITPLWYLHLLGALLVVPTGDTQSIAAFAGNISNLFSNMVKTDLDYSNVENVYAGMSSPITITGEGQYINAIYDDLSSFMNLRVQAVENIVGHATELLQENNTMLSKGASTYYIDDNLTLVNDDNSIVYVPVDARESLDIDGCSSPDRTQATNTISQTEALNVTFLQNKLMFDMNEKDLPFRTLQTFTTESGILRMFPPTELAVNRPDFDDTWLQSWVFAQQAPSYTAAATGAKDVVIAIDTSGSMKGTALYFASMTARKILSRLTPSDNVAVVAFGDTTSIFGASCHASGIKMLTSATARATRVLRDAVGALEVQGEAHVDTAMNAVLDLLARTPAPTSSARSQVVFWMSDGGEGKSAEDITAARNANTSVQFFTFFTTGSGFAKDSGGLRNIACNNRGVFQTIDYGQMIDVGLNKAFLRYLSANRNSSRTVQELLYASPVHVSISAQRQKVFTLAAPVYVPINVKEAFAYDNVDSPFAGVTAVETPLETLGRTVNASLANHTLTGMYAFVVDLIGQVLYHTLVPPPMMPREMHIAEIEQGLTADNVRALTADSRADTAQTITVDGVCPVRLLPSEMAFHTRPLDNLTVTYCALMAGYHTLWCMLWYTHRKLSAVPYVLVLATPSFVSGGASPPGGLTGAIVAAFDGRDQTVSGATTYVRLQQHAVCSDLSADTVVGNAALTATTSSSCGRAASTSPTTTATSTTTTMASTSTTVPTTVTIGTTTTPGTTPVTLQARQTVYVTDTWAPNANATASGLGMPTLYTILALSTPTGVLRTTPQDTVNPVGVPDITCQSVYNNWTLAVWIGRAVTIPTTASAAGTVAVVAAGMTADFFAAVCDRWLTPWLGPRGVDGWEAYLVDASGTTVAASLREHSDVGSDFLLTQRPDVVATLVQNTEGATAMSFANPVATCVVLPPASDTSKSSAWSGITHGTARMAADVASVVRGAVLWATVSLSVLLAGLTPHEAYVQSASDVVDTSGYPTTRCSANQTSLHLTTNATGTTAVSTLCSQGTTVVNISAVQGTTLFVLTVSRPSSCDFNPGSDYIGETTVPLPRDACPDVTAPTFGPDMLHFTPAACAASRGVFQRVSPAMQGLIAVCLLWLLMV